MRKSITDTGEAAPESPSRPLEGESDRSGGREASFRDPRLYLNRELSLLAFNERVFALAQDDRLPILERLRFLAICSSNVDEFFEIRVAGLQEQVAHEYERPGPDGLSAIETLESIAGAAHQLVHSQYALLNDEILPALEDEGIRVLRRTSWNERQKRWIAGYFRNEVLPVIAPIGLDPARPFPRILNKSLNFIVELSGRDALGREARVALVQVPRSLPRLIALPSNLEGGAYDFVMLSSVVHAHVEELFPGMKVTGCYQFRVTRNSDLWVDEEEIEDLLSALRGQLSQRRYGDAVRVEVADDCSTEMADFLLENFQLSDSDLYRVHGPVNLSRIAALYEMVARPDLKFPTFVPGLPRREYEPDDPFGSLRQGDVLLHHPYQSFQPVIDLLRHAARDPNVLAIKQTLYRTGKDSPLVQALLDAARAGKEVTAVIELRARFDEAANIKLATLLQEAGAKVVYGIVGYKCHAKMLLIVRREESRIQRYVHLGTGNYHAGTARAYGDIGLLTTNRRLAEDVHRIFLQLTSLGSAPELQLMLQSPFTLQPTVLECIEREARLAEEGKPARIIAKMNSLSDPTMIRALYRASCAGVRIDLIVRGICCLRPGVPGASENIRVRSLLGRFLEHARAWWFGADGDSRVWCSSADWMERNLYRRVETAFPIEDPEHVERVRHELFELALEDAPGVWELHSDGSYARVERDRDESAQTRLLQELASRDGSPPA